MTKLYIAGGALLVVLALAWYVVGLIQENQALQIADQQNRLAIERLTNDIRVKEEVNNERQRVLAKIQQRLNQAQRQVAWLQRTPQQQACDATSLPAGYVDSLLRAAGAAGAGAPAAR